METQLIDSFARKITYLRMSVTDRCDFRCFYCMPQKMKFMPRAQIATLEEFYRLSKIFASLGMTKLRLTGGEPLLRRNIMWLIERLGALKDEQKLTQLLMTSNGSQLYKMAKPLKQAGLDRINISLDSLDPHRFNLITRGGDLQQVQKGIDEARAQGIKIKLNVVALKGMNDDEFDDFVRFAGEKQADLTFIEVMPMGDIGNETRLSQYLPLAEVKQRLAKEWDLTPTTYQTGGPARYLLCHETQQKIGFITPLTQNFCENCNRVRITATARLYSCLGQDNQMDLLPLLRTHTDDDEPIIQAIFQAIADKPKGHDFHISQQKIQNTNRYMSMTGG